MREGFTALKSGYWEEYKGIFRVEVKATEWTLDRKKEAFEQVAQDEAEKLSIVREIMIRSTDYLRSIIAPARGQGGVTMSYLCPHCNSFPMEDYVWWVSGWKSIQIGGVRSVEKNRTGRNQQTGSWWCKPVKVWTRPRSSKHMQCLRACETCVEVAGKPARRWRRPYTEHRDKPREGKQKGSRGWFARIHED